MSRVIEFGDFPSEYRGYERAKVVIVPIPYDGTSTWMKGADKGPGAIIEASVNIEEYDIETGCEVYRIGIATDEAVEEGGVGGFAAFYVRGF